MNKTIELVNCWGDFEQKYPEGNIEDFCRHYLANQAQKKISGQLVGGVIPPFTDGLLLKIIGRIQKLNMNYANLALKGTEINQIEEFGVMQTIKKDKNPRKTDIIYANLLELSSGTDMLTRLKKRGLINEYDDKEDKRSKRIELTEKGKTNIEAAQLKIYKNAKLMMMDLSEDDKAVCIQLLKSVEIKFSGFWQKHKGKDFEEVYNEVVQSQ